MASPLIALIPAMIWAISPIYYRVFLKKFDFLSLNLVRTSLATVVLLVPALYFGFSGSVTFALLSGAITFAIGDTLYLLAIRETGASVAAPVSYTYVLFVQMTAFLVGEVVPLANFGSAVLVILGVFLLSRGGGGKPRAKGIAIALAGGVAWTVGQDMIAVVTNSGMNVVTIAFVRFFAAAVALAIVVAATGRQRNWPRVSARDFGFIAIIALADMVVGSLLFIYSVSTVGVALTVIVTSVSPFATQLLSRVMGREPPSNMDMAGGALIVVALILAVALA